MTYHYTMCGLDYVHLRNGYTLHETNYGPGVSVERADLLDRAIAIRVITANARLRGQEVRFLRALTGDSQAELARLLGVKRLTVARWETAPNTPIPGPADRTIRIVAARALFSEECLAVIADMLAEISDEQPEPLYMQYTRREEPAEPALFPDEADEEEGWRNTKMAA